MDRIIDMTFGSGEAAYHVILELYDRVGSCPSAVLLRRLALALQRVAYELLTLTAPSLTLTLTLGKHHSHGLQLRHLSPAAPKN